jgi:hypothetical protein
MLELFISDAFYWMWGNCHAGSLHVPFERAHVSAQNFIFGLWQNPVK